METFIVLKVSIFFLAPQSVPGTFRFDVTQSGSVYFTVFGK